MRTLLLLALLGLPVVLAQPDEDWLTTDEARYGDGDVVLIAFHNPSSSTVYLPAVPPWQVVDRTSGHVVHRPAATLDTVPVAPGAWWNDTYDMTVRNADADYGLVAQEGDTLPPGQYAVVFGVLHANGASTDFEAAFTVCTSPRGGASGVLDLVLRAAHCADVGAS